MLRTRTSDYMTTKPIFGGSVNAERYSTDSFIPDQDEWAEMNRFDYYDVDLKILN